MPEKATMQAAEEDLREGKSPSTAAGEFVREEMDHIREGKHGARNSKQAIAIGLSKARRAGIPLGPPSEKGQTNPQTGEEGHSKRGHARLIALKKEPKVAASHEALSKQAKSAAKKRGQHVHRSAA